MAMKGRRMASTTSIPNTRFTKIFLWPFFRVAIFSWSKIRIDGIKNHRHLREGGDPISLLLRGKTNGIPAFAGMTRRGRTVLAKRNMVSA
jgi:hypothetical protein